MKVIIIGNYLPDKQESMLRLAEMLKSGFDKAGLEVEVWSPKVIFGRFSTNTHSGMGKWLGYLDKWILFPATLRWRVLNKNEKEVRYHICDHSNAPYLSHLPANYTAITCCDVLAIRGGLGYSDAFVPATRMGKILQNWILANLKRAKRLTAISNLTLKQLNELTPPPNGPHDWRVIHLAFNAKFWPMPSTQAWDLLKNTELKKDMPFLLHVGSNLPRKNRALLLNMVAALGTRWKGVVCFAGATPDADLLAHADSLKLSHRVVMIEGPSHDMLVALYSTCAAFVFPSYSEGFGWPIIEAQACGAPVIASNIDPMPEVSGGAALHVEPADAVAFAEAFWLLEKTSVRQELIQQGYNNCQRYAPSVMIDAYLNLLSIDRPS